MWDLTPSDPVEPEDVVVGICTDCDKPQDYIAFDGSECTCENSSGYIDKLWYKCAGCDSVFPDDEDWALHECSGSAISESFEF